MHTSASQEARGGEKAARVTGQLALMARLGKVLSVLDVPVSARPLRLLSAVYSLCSCSWKLKCLQGDRVTVAQRPEVCLFFIVLVFILRFIYFVYTSTL